MLATKPHESALCGTVADSNAPVNRQLAQKFNEIKELEHLRNGVFKKISLKMKDLHDSLKATPQECLPDDEDEDRQPFARVVRDAEHLVTKRELKFAELDTESLTFTQAKRAQAPAGELREAPGVSRMSIAGDNQMRSRALYLLVLAAVALSACAVAPVAPAGYGYGYGYGYDAAPTWIDPAPYSRYDSYPPYYYQAVPVSPYVGGIWIDGSWSDGHGRREWRPGHWVPPRSGDVRGQPPHRGDGRYAGDPGHRPPRTDSGDHRDGRRGGWNSADRGAPRQVPQFPGAVFDAGSRTDPRITPP